MKQKPHKNKKNKFQNNKEAIYVKYYLLKLINNVFFLSNSRTKSHPRLSSCQIRSKKI